MSKPEKNIFLVGPRASGKTSLGKILAGRLGRPFVDLDAVFAERAGQSIKELVEAEGWERFREIETEVLRFVCATPGQVVATGGGAALKDENRELMRAGVALYLQSTPERLIARLRAELNEAQRPDLTGAGLEDEVRAVLLEREPVYLAMADAVLPDRELAEMAEAALKALRMLGTGSAGE
ncbi:MAG: shikimate kinase [Desulfovibrionaceae bacterium]|nr:shikimate kinase [Desulfovibrionaceae bacterium]MBF0513054.1 shikimate kinase [Desulfovibrionaceae bacterium]